MPGPYRIESRKDGRLSLTLFPERSGLSLSVCQKWQRKSFRNLADPPEPELFPPHKGAGGQIIRVAYATQKAGAQPPTLLALL
jgi:hypothetical protein